MLGAKRDDVDFSSFARRVYVLNDAVGSVSDKHRVVFAMFDVSGNGLLDKKEFLRTTSAILTAEASEAGADVKGASSELSKVCKTMVDAAFLAYDRDRDSKLSYEEWLRYAENDASVLSFIESV